MRRQNGLSFKRRRKIIHASAVQSILIWVGECVLAFGIGCVLVYFFMTSISCVGQAMEPSINSGDQVLIDRFIYSVTSPKRGDVVVFKPNGNENAHYYMRRVIGVPGETVQIIDGFVYVDGKLFETGIGNEQMDFSGLAADEITLGKGEYFVLGDGRDASEDSRNADIGNIKKSDIYGKAWFILTPLDDFGFIDGIKK